jgi:uncharacterized protein YunC (DUF1805 family)
MENFSGASRPTKTLSGVLIGSGRLNFHPPKKSTKSACKVQGLQGLQEFLQGLQGARLVKLKSLKSI